MNIFFLSLFPEHAAQYLCDMHASKMFLELMQLVSFAFAKYLSIEKAEKLGFYSYSKRHAHHPATLWVQASSGNFRWCLELGEAMLKDHQFRFNKDTKHKSYVILDLAHQHFHLIEDLFPKKKFTQPPLCMDEKYQINPKDVVESYRFYYRHAKFDFAVWRNKVPKPDWWDQMEVNQALIDEAIQERTERLEKAREKRERKAAGVGGRIKRSRKA